MKLIKNISLILFTLAAFFQVNAQEEKDPERWEETIRKFEKKDRKNPPKEGKILFTGSSSIVMYQDLAKHFPDHEVLNRGFGGSQFSDLLHYADRVIFPYRPSKIFIYEGDNDIFAGEKPEEVIKEAKELRKNIAKELPGVPVVFIAAKPSVARWEKKEQYEELNSGLKELADKTDRTMYADVWTAMLDDEGQVYDHVFLEDNLHMNAEGYKIWRKVLKPFLSNDRNN